MLKVQFKRLSELAVTPLRMTSRAAGFDLSAALDTEISIPPLGRSIIPTGLAIALPAGYEAQVRPRSGLAFQHGISVLNSPGTIDSDYRGEIRVILFNAGTEAFTVAPGMRIAQLVIAAVAETELEEAPDLDSTGRDGGGFGHTGL